MEFGPEGSPLKASQLWMSALDPNREAPDETAARTALLERAIAGDSVAFGQIIARHERRVLTLAWRLLGTLEDAEDAAQETFLRAFRYLHRCDSKKPIEGWLVRITINVCRDFGRSRQRRYIDPSTTESAEVPRNPHSELALEQQKAMLHQALASLPEKERTAVILRDIEGFSTAETAEALGSSETTVRSQISTARMKIKKAMERMMKGHRP